jgi:ribonuclease HII
MEPSALERALKLSGHRFIAGCDEAGRGALAGPVLAAAVVLSYDRLPAVLTDSKRMTRKRRELAAAQIKELAVAYATFRIEPREIERINILQASLKAMARAVDKLGIPVDCVLIDGNFAPKALARAQRRAPRVETIVGGDAKILCISAASIIAKVERDEIMRQYARMFRRYRFERNAGYGTDEHLTSLRRHGPCRLHRRTFKPVRELIQPGLFDG